MQKPKIHSETGYKYRLKISKTDHLKFISHLDWQKLIYYSVRKAGLKVNYSQGFNPSPKISIGIALPLFVEGKNEYIDVEFQEEIVENIIKDKINSVLPENSQISDIVKIPKEKQSIDKEVCWALYKAIPLQELNNKKINIESIAKDFLLKENVILEKQTKKGLKKINIKPGVHSLNFDKEKNTLEFILKTGAGCVERINPENIELNNCIKETNKETLESGDGKFLMQEKTSISPIRADEFVKILTPEMTWRITREKLLDCNFNELIN